jgi:predicted negative regulator of RcsB-dependent stress response
MAEQKEITLEAKTVQFLAKHAKAAAAAIVVCAVAGAAYIAYGMYEGSLEAKSQEELFTIQKTVEEKEQKLTKQDEASIEKAKAPKADAGPKFEKTPQSLAANFTDDLKRYADFIGSHKGKKASYMAAIQAARLAKEYKDFPQAEKILAGVVEVPNSNDIFSGLLRAQLGAILMDENKCPDAVKQLNQIVDNKAQSYFHAHSWLRLGACYIETKEWDKAQSALARVEKDFANTQAAGEAKDLKRLALLRSKGE